MASEPPAFSTAATADLEAPQTEKATLALISPEPSSRTPSLARRRTPALTRASASTVAPASSLPASMAACTRPRLTSLSLRANGVFLKPRFGSRRWSGIWPPSKPLMRTPERAVSPLPPRPPVLPVPEPMPRPMRARFLRAPGRSASSLSFIAQSPLSPSSLAVHHPHQMPHLGDHAARLRSVGQLAHAADAVESEPDQRLALRMLAANGAADLLDLDHFVGLAHLGLPALTLAQSAACSASPVSRRRPCSVDTLMLRRAATERGESWCLSASNVARTMLYGFDEPSDFATTSCMPSVSNTARIGPPAMMPVPGGAARRNTLPAP